MLKSNTGRSYATRYMPECNTLFTKERKCAHEYCSKSTFESNTTYSQVCVMRRNLWKGYRPQEIADTLFQGVSRTDAINIHQDHQKCF